jgi:outer membrane protein assembly factor BamD (BamD/ComL family)
MRLRPSLATLAAVGLGACGIIGPKEAPTLKTLADREFVVPKTEPIPGSEEKTIAAYRAFVKGAPRDRQRPEAMRRLGDLEMDDADIRSLADKSGSGAADYRGAVALYERLLKDYPDRTDNDHVLYQLGRAYEQGGELEKALKTLDRLVEQFPLTRHIDEAQFRRGELLFTMRDYAGAEKAYATVVHRTTPTAYHERSLYMHGWSVFKQGRLEDALQSFFAVLDLKLAGADSDAVQARVSGLTRADREMLEDTYRVTSLCLENLQGPESIPPYVNSPARHAYDFVVYQQLTDLYIKQERTKDAADTLGAFARRYPLHAQSPLFQARVIEIYQQAGFGMLAVQAKKEYVARYGVRSEFRSANPAGWERAQPLVKTHLTELARFYHAAAQKGKKSEDYQEAAHWYRVYLDSFPDDPHAAQINFLLAELLFEDKHFAEAAVEYDMTAYHYPPHQKSADAGYATLLSYTEQEKLTAPAAQKPVQLAFVDSAGKFARNFPTDPRAGPVLANAAEKLYALGDFPMATTVAQQVLALKPPAAAAQRRTAWIVTAHSAFDQGAFDRAEQGYREVLALTPEQDATRGAFVERLAASIYKQGEQARTAGELRQAVAHFNRVAAAAPQSPVRATAQYDTAAALITLKDWDGAAHTLEDFRQRYPNHPLQGEVGNKLAVTYTEQGKWALAAAEFERMAATTTKGAQFARDAQWQAADFYDKAGKRDAAAKAYERYVRQNPEPLEAAIEARYRLAKIAAAEGSPTRERAWMKELLQADQAGGDKRSDRTRYLAATAALSLAEPAFEEYRKVALVEPLQKQLKLKKAKMEEVLKAYGVAAEYGVADVATASTYRIAELYGDFGRSLMGSQRPKGLAKDEAEQYDVMLEEQAYPFEEKAIELHEINARRSAKGIYDAWVKSSYVALAKLRPVRYGKSERGEVTIDAIR